MSPSSHVADANWWRQAAIYQIYPRSFADANGDGIGDLKGITSKVPYLKSLGIDAVWLSPFYPSALKDGGYDVADYRNVDPKIGTLEDFDEMMTAMKAAGLQVMVDIVPNHSSNEHPWFQEALQSPKGSEARARFHFHDGKGSDQSKPPNDWQSVFGGSMWEPVGDGQFYLHIFDKSQPDLNWDNLEVREDFLTTLRFWGDRGVAGFRVDVAQALAKDMSEPFLTESEVQERNQWLHTPGQGSNYHPYFDRQEVFEIYKGWRKVFNEYDPPLTAVGEIFVAHDRVPLYASPEGLGQAFAFEIQKEAYDAESMRKTIDDLYYTARKAGSTTTWVLSNHDVVRHATRYGVPRAIETATKSGKAVHLINKDYCNELLVNKGKELDAELGLKRARAAILLILSLPGSAYMYQGEELGLPEVIDIPDGKRDDPIFFQTKGAEIGRDGCRIPIPWDRSSPTCGFSPSGATQEPWLPVPDWFKDFSVEKEDGEADSTLNLYRKALASRQELQDGSEQMEWVSKRDGVLHFKRPGGWEVVFNLNSEEAVDVPKGKIVVASDQLEGGRLPINTSVWVRTE